MAAVAAPAMGPVSDIIVGTLGDSLVVELGTHVGFKLTTKVANDLVFDKTSNLLIPIHSARLQTTGVKMLLIDVWHVPIWVSLLMIVVVLGATAILSLRAEPHKPDGATRKDPSRRETPVA